MSVVLFGGEKGGTGKTTLATNMAAMLALAGRDVLLLDTDRQGTASFWATVREEADVAPQISCVQKFSKGLATQIRDLAGRYDEIVIDAGGRDSMELRYALGVADRAYVPVQPFQFDIWTLQQMEELVEMARASMTTCRPSSSSTGCPQIPLFVKTRRPGIFSREKISSTWPWSTRSSVIASRFANQPGTACP